MLYLLSSHKRYVCVQVLVGSSGEGRGFGKVYPEDLTSVNKTECPPVGPTTVPPTDTLVRQTSSVRVRRFCLSNRGPRTTPVTGPLFGTRWGE